MSIVFGKHKKKIDFHIFWNYSLLLVAFTIPIGTIANSISIILFFIFSCLTEFTSSRPFSFKGFTSKINIIVLYFLLILFGLFYSSNLDIGIKILLRNLSFFVIPVSFALSYQRSFSLEKVLLSFAISVSILLIFAHISMSIELLREDDNFSLLVSHYLRNNFVRHSVVNMHAPYFGMFSVFAFIIIIKSKLINKYLKIIIGMYLLFCIYLLSAVMSIIILEIIIFVLAVKFFLKQKLINRIKIFSVVVFSISTFFLIAKRVDINNSSNVVVRIDKLIKNGGDSDRIENWKSILRLPINSLLIGVGTGDELEEIQKVRNHEGWAWAYRQNANMHNQYLEVLLRNGILGLIIFLLILINLFRRLKKYNDFRYLSFLLLITISFMTESMLERQWGIVYFAFFSSVFIFAYEEKSKFNRKLD